MLWSERIFLLLYICVYSTQIHIANAHKRLSKKFTIYECTVTQLLQSIMWYIHIHTFFYILHNKHYRINPYFCKLFFSVSVESRQSSKPNWVLGASTEWIERLLWSEANRWIDLFLVSRLPLSHCSRLCHCHVSFFRQFSGCG